MVVVVVVVRAARPPAIFKSRDENLYFLITVSAIPFVANTFATAMAGKSEKTSSAER